MVQVVLSACTECHKPFAYLLLTRWGGRGGGFSVNGRGFLLDRIKLLHAMTNSCEDFPLCHVRSLLRPFGFVANVFDTLASILGYGFAALANVLHSAFCITDDFIFLFAGGVAVVEAEVVVEVVSSANTALAPANTVEIAIKLTNVFFITFS